MTRRNFSGLLAGGLGAALSTNGYSQNRSQPKNILLLMSDQHRPHALGWMAIPTAPIRFVCLRGPHC